MRFSSLLFGSQQQRHPPAGDPWDAGVAGPTWVCGEGDRAKASAAAPEAGGIAGGSLGPSCCWSRLCPLPPAESGHRREPHARKQGGKEASNAHGHPQHYVLKSHKFRRKADKGSLRPACMCRDEVSLYVAPMEVHVQFSVKSALKLDSEAMAHYCTQPPPALTHKLAIDLFHNDGILATYPGRRLAAQCCGCGSRGTAIDGDLVSHV